MIIAIVYLDYHHSFIINIIILPQAAPLGAAAAAAELTRLFPGRKSPELAVWRSWRGNFDVLSFVRLFLPLLSRSWFKSETFCKNLREIVAVVDKVGWVDPVSGSFHLGNKNFPISGNTQEHYYHKNYELHHNAAVTPVTKLQIPDPPCGWALSPQCHWRLCKKFFQSHGEPWLWDWLNNAIGHSIKPWLWDWLEQH